MSNYLIETPADVLQVIEEFEKQTFIKPQGQDLIALLETIIDSTRKIVLANKKQIDWPTWFLRTGFVVYSILVNYKFNKLDFAKFLIGKHKLYGANALLVWKELGILIRLNSKVARLKHITSSTPETINLNDESVEDTLKDSLGYCILGYTLCQKSFTQLKEKS